jgi:hypothetical protein
MSEHDTIRRIANLVALGHLAEAKRLLVQAGGSQANDTVVAVMEGQRAELLRLRMLTADLNAQLASIREDSARIKWIQAQPALALWSGRLGKDGSSVFDISRMSEDGGTVEECVASGCDVRAAIDAARKEAQQ